MAQGESVDLHRAQSVPVELCSNSHSLNPRRNAGLAARIRLAGTVDKFMGNRRQDHRSRRERVEQASLVVGPIIGKVTHNSARVLIETSRDSLVTAVLEVEDPADYSDPIQSRSWVSSAMRWGSLQIAKRSRSSVVEDHKPSTLERSASTIQQERQFRCGRPGVFHFTNLAPGTRYKLAFQGCVYSNTGSFKTLSAPGSRSSFNFGVVSCNNVYITHRAIPIHSDLWSHLYKAINARKLDYLVHLGDQIYADVDPEVGGPELDRFQVAKLMLADVAPCNRKNKEQDVCELYRKAYRETWNYPPTAKCLANCPNLMILDDHEIRDNWGDLPEDWDEGSVEFFIARCAWIVYLEYQRQLHEDIDFSSLEDIQKEYHFHVLGGVGFMFVDIRGSRTFHRLKDDKNKYLGTQQWKDISDSLSSPAGIFNGVAALFLCATAPLVFLEPVITNVAAKRVNRLEDFKGHWSAQPHTEEQIRMIDALTSWKTARDGRQVLVLGGDVHCGGHSEILKDNEVVFQQLTSSAIANTPLPKTAYYFMRLIGRLGGSLRTGYTFKHYHWTRSRNYGLVQVKILRGDQDKPCSAEITTQLVKGKFMRGILMGGKVSSSTKKSKRKKLPLRLCCT